MKKTESPWKNSMMDLFSNPESVELGPGDKNPANCDLQACVMEVPPTPLVTALGYSTGVKVYVVKRNLATVERSPWTIQMLCPRNDPTKKQLFEKRLSREAALLLQLKHPNIAGYRSFEGIDEARNFIALEYLTTSLGQILENRYNTNAGALEAYKTKRMIIHLLRGLVYLHESAHILHGDIKSFNILIKKDFENATICDFGASAPVDQEGFLDRKKAPEGRYVGTSLWSAPEVFSNEPHLICVKADIFALGMTIYETLTLTPPHTFAGIMDETIQATVDRRPMDMSLGGEEEDGYEEEGEFAEEEDQIADEEDQIADEEDDVPEEDDEVHGEDGEVHGEDGKVHGEDGDVPGEDGAEEGVAGEAPKGEMLEMIGDEEIEALCKDIVESHKRKLADDGEEHLLKKRKTSGEDSVADSVGGKSLTADEDAQGNPSNDGDVPRDDEQKDSPMPEAETSFAGSDDSGRTTPVSGSERRRAEQKESDPASTSIDPEIISISSDESVEELPRSGIVLEVESDSEYEEYYEEESDHEFASNADAEGEYEEDDYEDGQYLNYAVLGTRPPIPSSIEIGKEHLPLVELFYVCTESLPNDRPTARQLLDALTKTMWKQGETDALEQQTVDDEKKPCHESTKAMPLQGEMEATETKTVDAEPQPSDAETQPMDAETQPSDAEPQPCHELTKAMPEQGEIKATETKTVDAEAQPLEAETQPMDAETQPSVAEIQPSGAETQPSDAETQPCHELTKAMPEQGEIEATETKTVDAEPQPLDAESQPSDAKTQPSDAETQPLHAETQPLHAEPQPCHELTKAMPEQGEIEATETKTVDAETQPSDDKQANG